METLLREERGLDHGGSRRKGEHTESLQGARTNSRPLQGSCCSAQIKTRLWKKMVTRFNMCFQWCLESRELNTLVLCACQSAVLWPSLLSRSRKMWQMFLLTRENLNFPVPVLGNRLQRGSHDHLSQRGACDALKICGTFKDCLKPQHSCPEPARSDAQTLGRQRKCRHIEKQTPEMRHICGCRKKLGGVLTAKI